MKKKLFIIAGEKSGDLLGSKILAKIDKEKFTIEGIGGSLMEATGLRSRFPMKELSLMGFFEILPRAFKLLQLINDTAKYIVKTKQDIVLTIDSPGFCFRVMEKVKKLDKENRIKKIHFVAPSVWAYRKGRAKKISKIYDRLFCILPFEPPYFEKYGLKTIFVGHPIFDKDSLEYSFNSGLVSYKEDSKIISVTVGSRVNEVKKLLPIILKSIAMLNKKYGDFTYNFLVTEDTYDMVSKAIRASGIKNTKILIKQSDKNNSLEDSVLAIAKSGTNTLEIAASSTPMVVIYKFNGITNFIVRILRYFSNIKFANLINIISAKEVIPELILNRCNSANIFNSVSNMLENKQLRLEQISTGIKVLEKLGFNGNNSSSARIVKEIYRLTDA